MGRKPGVSTPHRPKDVRVRAKIDEALNLVKAVELTDDEREALKIVERLQEKAAAAALAGKLSTGAVKGEHPVLAAIREEAKRARSEAGKLDTVLRRIENLREEVAIFEENAEYRRVILPWLERQIPLIEEQIKAGKEPAPESRPDIERIDVISMLKDLRASRVKPRQPKPKNETVTETVTETETETEV